MRNQTGGITAGAMYIALPKYELIVLSTDNRLGGNEDRIFQDTTDRQLAGYFYHEKTSLDQKIYVQSCQKRIQRKTREQCVDTT